MQTPVEKHEQYLRAATTAIRKWQNTQDKKLIEMMYASELIGERNNAIKEVCTEIRSLAVYMPNSEVFFNLADTIEKKFGVKND